MKSMRIDKVINFPFPTPPSGGNLFEAEKVSEDRHEIVYSSFSC